MTTLADLDLAAEPGQPNLGAPPPRKPPHRHVWGVTLVDEDSGETHYCRDLCRCGVFRDPVKSRRGKTSRRRGNDYERSVANRLGLKRVGQFGSSVDVGGSGEWAAVQVKNGGAFPERVWTWLQALPHDAMHVRAVVIGDAPGAGVKRREVIVLDFDDFVKWFGK